MKENVLIVGFTKRTSLFAAEALLKKGYNVLISDTVKNEEKEKLLNELRKFGQTVDLLGRQDEAILSEYKVAFVMLSPGVPRSIPLIQTAIEKEIEVIGDIELFYRWFPDMHISAITGTDGKTTTTTLTHAMISKEKNAVIGGNVGTPVFAHFDKMPPETRAVLELSSFQLESISRFRPRVAALLNISADHLNRYDGMDGYINAKLNIFENQRPEDFAVLNRDCSSFSKAKKAVKSTLLTFSRKFKNANAYFDGETVFIDQKPYLKRNEIALEGIHNVENAMAAILMARAGGINDESIQSTLLEFTGLPHRLEFVREIGGVRFFNDSKATTVNSVEKALLSFDSPVILIAGGRDKGLDFSLLKELSDTRVKTLVLIGEAAEKIDASLSHRDTVFAESFEDAVKIALKKSASGDVVTLSPGCTSYDMFQSYEERGDRFKEIVKEL